MNWQEFAKQLSQQLNQQIHINHSQPIHGGDINQAFWLQTSQGDLFAKFNAAHFLPMMQAEVTSLDWIDKTHTIRCPKPLAVGEFENQAWLVMEFLPISGGRQNELARGQLIAKMHQQLRQEHSAFGWFEDNFIGKTRQKNAWHTNWASFYGEQRLRPQLELAQQHGAPKQLFEQGQTLINQLDCWFESYQPVASLLHGDLWAGNSDFLQNGTPVIFDPASYFGDRETDIAMTELFGGYSAEFYRGYNQVFPLDAGYRDRKDLYNLYHILNHFNLFGAGYLTQAQTMIKRLLDYAQKV